MITTTNRIARPTTASDRLALLVGDAEIIEITTHTYCGHAIAIAQLVGDPDSDGDDYYGPTAVAWDAGLDRPGESGSCYAPDVDSATWFALRWPATTRAGGFLRDGSWTDHPLRFGDR